MLSPSSSSNELFGFSSPLNINASQFNNKSHNNFSILNNYYGHNAEGIEINTGSFNPLSFLSNYHFNNLFQQQGQNNIVTNNIINNNKEEIFENLVNPLSCFNTFNNHNQIFDEEKQEKHENSKMDDRDESNHTFTSNNYNYNNYHKPKLSSLNMDLINKADTAKIFTESVLSCFNDNHNNINNHDYYHDNNRDNNDNHDNNDYSESNDVIKPNCINYKYNNDFFDLSTKDISLYGSGQKKILIEDKSPTNSTTGKQLNFYLSPKTCFTKNYNDM